MAVFGMGAFWDDRDDMVERFLREGCACIGWSRADAPTLYEILARVHIGSIVYLKSFNPQSGLRIKAVGIVTAKGVPTSLNEESLRVAWIWTGEDIVGAITDKYPVRINDLRRTQPRYSSESCRTASFSRGAGSCVKKPSLRF